MNLRKKLRGKPYYMFLQTLYGSRNGKMINENLLVWLSLIISIKNFNELR